jgi:hypothetical protein
MLRALSQTCVVLVFAFFAIGLARADAPIELLDQGIEYLAKGALWFAALHWLLKEGGDV